MKTVEELEARISELENELAKKNKCNTWSMRYKDYVYNRLGRYGYTEMSPELGTAYTAVRKVARVRYFGNKVTSLQIPHDEKSYKLFTGYIDDMIPDKESVR